LFTDFSNAKSPRWTPEGVFASCKRIGLADENVLLAIVKVETGGRGYQANGKLKMLFEPHIFYSNLRDDPAKLALAVNAGVAYQYWGERPYPSDSYARLTAAMAIDETAALESASWGLPQVMGGNWKMCGFKAPQLMVSKMADNEDAQVDVMASFLVAAGLSAAMHDKDWAKIARGYNGPGYAANHYDTKLAAAYAALPRFATEADPAPQEVVYAKPEIIQFPPGVPETTSESPELGTTTLGATTDTATGLSPSTGSAVILPPLPPGAITDTGITLFVQQRLKALGYASVGNADGNAGDWTEAAILDFRNSHNKAFPAQPPLPLVPTIDSDLVLALAQGPAKSISDARATATAASPVVASLPTTIAAGKNKLVAWIVGAPAALAGAIEGVVGNLPNAKASLDPVRDFASAVPAWAWPIGVAIVAFVVWANAHSTQAAVAQAVRKGTTV
jgi:peptidoglycan hydrolase-like protein with peptidoglycan-binding domain